MVIVPCTPGGSSAWTQRTGLAGVDYLLSFRWSQRAGHWFLDVADAGGTPIATGRLVSTGWKLLRGVVDDRRPPGDLVCLDTLGQGMDPGFSDLGARFVLVYLDPSELGGG